MDGVSLVVGIVPIVFQLYKAVSAAYDTYVDYKEFPAQYRELQTCFLIERERLRLWGENMLSANRHGENELSQQDVRLWKLFEFIFTNMASDLEIGGQMMEKYRQLAGVSKESDPLSRPSNGLPCLRVG